MANAPKKKTLRWLVLFVVTGFVDLVQIIIDFTGVGIVVSEVLEIITPLVLVGLLMLFRIPIFTHPKRLLSILAVGAGDALTGGIAPFWILDVWYIYSDVKKEEAELQEQQEKEMMLSNITRQPLYRDGIRQSSSQTNRSNNPQPMNKLGIRPPKGGLVS